MMMNNYMGFIIFFLFIGLASSTYISDDVFASHKSNGRSLLQAKKRITSILFVAHITRACPVNFENQNYTILTSQCKGPRYSAESCCNAFKEFACPFAENINDQSSNCADTMFSYINLFGSYPPGTFASLCKEGKNGLECTEDGSPNADPKSKKNSASTNIAQSPIAVLLVSSLMYLLHLL